MTYQAAVDAALALLRADTSLTVYPAPDGAPAGELVPTGAVPPYVAVHAVRDFAPTGDLSSDTRQQRVRLYAHCVGLTDAAARVVAGRVQAVWLDITPTVAGLVCWPIRWDSSAYQADETTGVRVVELTEVYRLESVPR